MQPFDKHPADGAALQAYGDQLIDQGAQSLILGLSTRRAYSPAIPSVQGVPAPAIAAAPDPVDQASSNSSGALVWAAMTTQFWGDQVVDFNTKVDQIVANLAAEESAIIAKYDAQATPGAVPGGGQTPAGQTQNAQDTAEALERIGATMRAREEWQKAYAQHIEAGGAQAAAMLAQGPTAANQKVARDAGFMPDMEFTGLLNLMNKAGARIFLPSPAPHADNAGALNFGEQLLNIVGYADRMWRAKNLTFHPGGPPLGGGPLRAWRGGRPPVQGPIAPYPPGSSPLDRARAFNDPKNWVAPNPQTESTARRLDRVGKVGRVGGPILSALSGAYDQYTRDNGRPDIGQTEQNARAAFRGTAAGAGSLGGAWLGAKAGGLLGASSGNPYAAGAGAIVGGAAGFIFGGAAVNTVVDEALYRPPPQAVAPGASFTPAPQAGPPPV